MTFAHTGNIEIRRDGQRLLVGQMVNGNFILNEKYREDEKALERIRDCASIVTDLYGRTAPQLIWKAY